MLETEEVDDDYFTPIAKTSLANIFKEPLPKEKSENDTLKYSPPVANSELKKEEPHIKRNYENIFSCVFDAYLWLDNIYTHKGKIGCAVVKLITARPPYFHSVLLYDSKKTTLSSATLTKELEVTVKGKDHISYYDSYNNYWCLSGSEDDIKKIRDIFETCDVTIKLFNESNNVLPDQNTSETTDGKIQNTNEHDESQRTKSYISEVKKKNIGSDTDSSVNRKTKASILNRMANMGQSVLPPRTFMNDQTSDSSDTNESEKHIITARSKPAKTVVKKNIVEVNVLEQQRKTDIYNKGIAPTPRIRHSTESKMPVVSSDQLLPLQSSSIIASTPGNDLNFFMTEQRITNSELRINMTRITDKVDNILSKVNDLETKDKYDGNTVNTEIFQKLLKEYECKIITYENLLKNSGIDPNTSQRGSSETSLEKNEVVLLRNEITELHNCIKQKDEMISVLNSEIKNLRENNNYSQNFKHTETELLAKISQLEQDLSTKNEILEKLTLQNDDLLNKSHDTHDHIESKIKTIMNDTFQAIAANLENTESYSGETIKTIIASVIKKVTRDCLYQSGQV